MITLTKTLANSKQELLVYFRSRAKESLEEIRRIYGIKQYKEQASAINIDGIAARECFIPIVKGGAVKYIKPDNWYIDWSIDAVKCYKTDKKARFQNSSYYFKQGIGVPMVSASQITGVLMEYRLFDQPIVGIFPKDEKWIYYLLALFNSPTYNRLIRTINSSANNSANYIKKIPFIIPGNDVLSIIDSKMIKILSDIRKSSRYYQEDEKFVNELIQDLYGL